MVVLCNYCGSNHRNRGVSSALRKNYFSLSGRGGFSYKFKSLLYKFFNCCFWAFVYLILNVVWFLIRCVQFCLFFVKFLLRALLHLCYILLSYIICILRVYFSNIKSRISDWFWLLFLCPSSILLKIYSRLVVKAHSVSMWVYSTFAFLLELILGFIVFATQPFEWLYLLVFVVYRYIYSKYSYLKFNRYSIFCNFLSKFECIFVEGLFDQIFILCLLFSYLVKFPQMLVVNSMRLRQFLFGGLFFRYSCLILFSVIYAVNVLYVCIHKHMCNIKFVFSKLFGLGSFYTFEMLIGLLRILYLQQKRRSNIFFVFFTNRQVTMQRLLIRLYILTSSLPKLIESFIKSSTLFISRLVSELMPYVGNSRVAATLVVLLISIILILVLFILLQLLLSYPTMYFSQQFGFQSFVSSWRGVLI